jgi:hypothetical protein
MSWKPEVQTDNTGNWYDNALRFETEQEAYENAADLAWRWTSVRDYRAAQSSDPINYSYIDRKLEVIV